MGNQVKILCARSAQENFYGLYPVTRSIFYSVTQSFGYPVTRLPGHLVTRSPGRFRQLGHWVTRSISTIRLPGQKTVGGSVGRLLGHPVDFEKGGGGVGGEVTGSLGHPVKKRWGGRWGGHWVTRLPGQKTVGHFTKFFFHASRAD